MCILLEQFLDEELDMRGISNIVNKFTEYYVY